MNYISTASDPRQTKNIGHSWQLDPNVWWEISQIYIEYISLSDKCLMNHESFFTCTGDPWIRLALEMTLEWIRSILPVSINELYWHWQCPWMNEICTASVYEWMRSALPVSVNELDEHCYIWAAVKRLVGAMPCHPHYSHIAPNGVGLFLAACLFTAASLRGGGAGGGLAGRRGGWQGRVTHIRTEAAAAT